MERLIEDAIHIKNLLPWLESEEDIINFMRKIPLDKNHLRNQLTLRHFLSQRDLDDNNIEDDAREIVIVMPNTSYTEIKKKLFILGNIPNRKEVVLRQLLFEQHGSIDKVLREISAVNKRKTISSSENPININIKIRKVDGTFEATPVLSENRPSTSKVFDDGNERIEKPSTSTSVSSSTCSLNSVPHSTVPSTSKEPDDPCPELTAIINEVISSPSLSTSAPVMSRLAKPSTVINNIGFGSPSTTVILDETIEPCTDSNGGTDDFTVTAITDDFRSEKHEQEPKQPKFDLISYVKEFCLAPEIKIYELCKKMGLELNKRPSAERLNFLLNHLLEDVVEIKSPESSGSETQEYNYIDDLPSLPLPYTMARREEQKIKPADKSFIVASNTIDPMYALNSGVASAADPNRMLFAPLKSQPESAAMFKATRPALPQLKRFALPEVTRYASVIQPATFNPAPRENTIPAMPPRFLAAMQTNIPAGTDGAVTVIEDAPGTPIDEPSENLGDVEDMIIDENDDDAALNLSTNGEVERVEQPLVDFCRGAQPGPSNAGVPKKKKVLDQNLVLRLIEMFPEACPDYIRNVCEGKQWVDLDDVVTIILSAPDYPKRPERIQSPPKEVDPEEQFEIIKELLPDADPTYLRIQCERFANNDKGLKEFIDNAMEQKDYPTMKEYLRKQQLSAQQKQYTTEFNIDNFMQLFPEPEKTFNDPKKNVKLDAYAHHYLNAYFKNRYDKITARTIQQVLAQRGFKILECDKIFSALMRKNNVMKSRRKPSPLPENLENIPVLQELAYLTHKGEIETYILEKRKREERERIEAKKLGLMETCQCCYDDEVMPKDTFNCPNGCKFCRECIQKSCEVAFGEGKTEFPCLTDCSTEFSLQTLQTILPPKMFSKVAQKKALAEIKAAGIEELETCPFCDFATIPNETDKIFRCLNPDCMKESCRKCKEPNHVPLKCEEVEKDQDVKARTYIENKMTEALLRKCYKCGTSFFKEEGCNKMTCSCGASMCYLCGQPVKDYTHFNGIGGDKYNLCQLYSDTNLVNQQNVLGAAEAAKKEIDPSQLKVDPTVGIKEHYKDRANKLPREPHMDVLHHAQQHIHMNLGHRQHGQRPRHRHQAAARQFQDLRRNLGNVQQIREQLQIMMAQVEHPRLRFDN